MKQKRFEKNKMEWILLAVLVVLWCVIIGQKEGFHMDELISYEMANAEYTPWILPTRPTGRLERFLEEEVYQDSFSGTLSAFFATAKDTVINRGSSKLATYEKEDFEEPVWISRGEFVDYITTTGHDRFRPDSVYFNVITDNHPPLHFMALNLVCSIVGGRFSPVLGSLINLVCLFFIAWILCDLGEMLYGKREVGQAAALLYGTSLLGLSTLVLTRMYAMLTLFCVLVARIVLQKYKEKTFAEHNKTLILVTCLGFWTQYFFLLYLIPLAVCVVVLLWREARKKEMLIYIRSMVIAGIIGLLVYPFAIDDVLHSGRGVEALENLGTGGGTLSRYGTMLKVLGQELFGDGVLALVLVALLVGFALWQILRKKEDANHSTSFHIFTKERTLLLLPALVYFLVVVKAIPYLEDRYIMAIGGFAALFACGLFYELVGKKLKNGRMAMMLILLCAIVGILQSGPNYLYKGYGSQWNVAKEYRNMDCLCIYEGVRYYENLPEFAEYENTLLLTMDELQSRSADEKLEKEDQLMVLAKRQIDTVELSRILHQNYGLELDSTVQTDSPFGDQLMVFTKKTGTKLW